jgi:hypothetical protein
VPLGSVADLVPDPRSGFLLAGYELAPSRLTLASMTERGALKQDFGEGGYTTVLDVGQARLPYACIAADAAGLVLAGEVGLIARYSLSGKPDPTFASDGRVPFADRACPIGVDESGRVLLLLKTTSTQGGRLTRITPQGTVDTSFGAQGRTLSTIREGLADWTSALVEPDGRIVAVGELREGADIRFAIARYWP